MAISFGGKSYSPKPPRLRKPKITAAKPKDYGAGITAKSLTTGLKSNPAGGPAVPSSPYVAPGPDESWKDQTFFDDTAGITKNLNNLKTYLVTAGDAIGADSGVSFDRDPNDPLKASNFRIDPNVDVTNPFSRAALLKRSHQQATRGNTNSYASQGQLYSGALQNAQNEAGRQNLEAQDSLIKDFTSKFGGLYQNWLAGNTDAGTQTINAQVAATGRHQNDPVVTPGFREINYKDTAKAGLKVEAGPRGFVVKDSQGNVVKGATVHVVGKRRFIRVPT